MAETGPEPERSKRSLRPLSRLVPYMLKYRGLVGAAIVSLGLAAVTTLTLPLAVRRMVDHGFSETNSDLIATYFSALLGISALSRSLPRLGTISSWCWANGWSPTCAATPSRM